MVEIRCSPVIIKKGMFLIEKGIDTKQKNILFGEIALGIFYYKSKHEIF